jgi:hypothetical protein
MVRMAMKRYPRGPIRSPKPKKLELILSEGIASLGHLPILDSSLRKIRQRSAFFRSKVKTSGDK